MAKGRPGRPSELKEPERVTFHIERADAEAMRRRAEREDRTLADVLREAVRAYLGRKPRDR